MTLHLREWGEGEPLVCLHGICGVGGALSRRSRPALPGRAAPRPRPARARASEREPPWSLEQHLEDVLDTVGEERARVARPLVRRSALRRAREPASGARRAPRPARSGAAAAAAERVPARRGGAAGRGGRRLLARRGVAMYGELARASPVFPRVPTLLVLGRDESVVGPNRRRLYAEALGPQARDRRRPGRPHRASRRARRDRCRGCRVPSGPVTAVEPEPERATAPPHAVSAPPRRARPRAPSANSSHVPSVDTVQRRGFPRSR